MSLPPLSEPWRTDADGEEHYSPMCMQAYGQACREAALKEAAALCNGEQWMLSGKKSIDYINAFNEGCTDCEAVIRRLK